MTCDCSGGMDNVTAKVECTQCHGDPHKPTLSDDANNDERVDFDDLLMLAQNYNKSL